GEQLCQRRSNRFQQTLLPYEAHIGIAGEARRWKHAFAAGDIAAVEPHSLGENEPTLDTALARPGSVVIDDAANPTAPKIDIVRTRDQARVLQRNRFLVIEPVQHPSLQLTLGETA